MFGRLLLISKLTILEYACLSPLRISIHTEVQYFQCKTTHASSSAYAIFCSKTSPTLFTYSCQHKLRNMWNGTARLVDWLLLLESLAISATFITQLHTWHFLLSNHFLCGTCPHQMLLLYSLSLITDKEKRPDRVTPQWPILRTSAKGVWRSTWGVDFVAISYQHCNPM